MNNDDGQRSEKRVTINKEFESFDAFVHEYVTNVSRSGVFIRSREPMPVGTEVHLTFTVIMDEVGHVPEGGVDLLTAKLAVSSSMRLIPLRFTLR